MLAAFRRAWRRYLDSLPNSEDPKPVSNAAILRELNPPQAPHAPAVQEALSALAQAITEHLQTEKAAQSASRLRTKLKAGVMPSEALSCWISANSGHKSANLGVMALDWKAREEIHWQAMRLARAHRIELDWAYDHRTDRSWEGWQEKDELPVSAPLRALSSAMRKNGLGLYVFAEDDAVYAFATAAEHKEKVTQLCNFLGISIHSDA